MKKIAITGGIGSGKSLVGKLIAEQGYDVFSCDAIYADLMQDSKYIQKIQNVFPSAVANGKIDKKILGELVFNCPENRAILDAIAHPLIMQTLDEKLEASKTALTFAEVPLLFENNFQNQFDYVIVVLRDMQHRIDAIMQRNGLSKEDCQKRIFAQFDYDTAKLAGAFPKHCFLIENNADIQTLNKNLLSIIDNVKHKV